MISEGPLREYAGAGPLNTEDKPLLEYGAPRAFFVNRKATDITRFDERMAFGRSTLFLNQLVSRRSLSDEERLHIGLFHADFGRGNLSVGYSMLSEYLAAHPNDGRVLVALAGLADRLGRKEEQVRLLARAAAVYPENPSVLEQYASAKFTSDRSVATPFAPFDASVPERSIQRCIELTADTVDYYRIKLADLYFGMQQYQRAFDGDPLDPSDTLALHTSLRDKLGPVVYAGAFVSDGARSAEVLLPSTAWAEEDGTFLNFEGRAQRVRRCHAPRGEARPGWRICADLAAAAGVDFPSWTSDRDVLADLVSASARFTGLDAESMGLLGVPVEGGAATRV